MLTQRKKEFILFMLQSNVLEFGDFITKSGRKTPYFINTGNYKTGRQFNVLSKFYVQMIKECGCKYDAMFGPAYKGIPLVACCANALYREYAEDKPIFFNRKEIKDHGEGGNIIGYRPKDGDKIIIIEDVITAGTAIREVFPTLKSFGDIFCEDMFISVNRCEVGINFNKTAVDELKEEFGINVRSVITVLDIYEYLKMQGGYENYIKEMGEYIKSYCIL